MFSKARKVELRQALLGLVLIGCAVTFVVNLGCALVYRAVFLTVPRSHGWVALADSPARFTVSVLMSFGSAILLGWGGVLVIRSAKDARRFIERLYSDRPRYEDRSHTYEIEP